MSGNDFLKGLQFNPSDFKPNQSIVDYVANTRKHYEGNK